MRGGVRLGARRLGPLPLALLLAWALAPAAAGAEADFEPSGWAYELADELMSPYCPGRTLSECPSQQADTLRMWLLVQEAAGRDKQEVKRELVERFGEVILPAPPARGVGLAAYATPVVGFLAGGALLWFFLRRLTRTEPAAEAPPAASALDPELERIVDRELSG